MLEQKSSENDMDYKHFMGKALVQARKALSAGEFPVGSVIVYQDRILATGSRKGTSGNFQMKLTMLKS